MATVTYTLSGDTVNFAFTPTSGTGAHTYRLTFTSGLLTASDTFAGDIEFPPYDISVQGVGAGTSYSFAWTWGTYAEGEYSEIENGTITVEVPSDDPRAATQSQWEDLIDRVKAKSDVVINMTTTDPGEGAATTANTFTAVYQ